MFTTFSQRQVIKKTEDIKLVEFDNLKSFASKIKHEYMGRVRDCLGHRLEHEEESEDVLVVRCIRCIHLILAFQTWVKKRYRTCRRYNFFFL